MTDVEYPEGRAYAQTTRIELGETLGRYYHNPDLRFVVGFEKGYVGGSEGYVRRMLGAVGLSVVDSEDEFLSSINDELSGFSRTKF